MLKFKKGYNLKIISVIISMVFLCNTSLYSYPDSKDSLRVPVGIKDTYKRITEYIKTYEEQEKAIDPNLNAAHKDKRVEAFSKSHLKEIEEAHNFLKANGFNEDEIGLFVALQDRAIIEVQGWDKGGLWLVTPNKDQALPDEHASDRGGIHIVNYPDTDLACSYIHGIAAYVGLTHEKSATLEDAFIKWRNEANPMSEELKKEFQEGIEARNRDSLLLTHLSELEKQGIYQRDYTKQLSRRDFLKLAASGLLALLLADKFGVIEWIANFYKSNTTQFKTVEEKLVVIKKLTETIQDTDIVHYGSTQEIGNAINLRNQLVDELLAVDDSEVYEQLVDALSLKDAEEKVFRETGFIIEGATRYREISYIFGLLKALPRGHLKNLRSFFVTRIAIDSSKFGEGAKMGGFYSLGSYIALVPFGYLLNKGYIYGDNLNHEVGHNAQTLRTDLEKESWLSLYSASSGETDFITKYAGTNDIEDNAEVYKYFTTDTQFLVNKVLQDKNMILQKKVLELVLSPRDAEPFLRFENGKSYLYIFKANHIAEIELPFKSEDEIINDPENSFKILYDKVSSYEFEGFEFDLIRLIKNNRLEDAINLLMEQYGDKENGALILNENLEDLFAQLMWIDVDNPLTLISMDKTPKASITKTLMSGISSDSITNEDIKKYFNIKTPALKDFIEEAVPAERILSVFGVKYNASAEQIIKGIQEMGIGTFYEENTRDFYASSAGINLPESTHGNKITDGLGIALAHIMLEDIEKAAQIKHLLDEANKKLIESGSVINPWSMSSPLAAFIELYPDEAIEILKMHKELTAEFTIAENQTALLKIIKLDNKLAIEVIDIIEQSGRESLVTTAFRLMIQLEGIDVQDVHGFWNYVVTSKGEDWLKVRLERYFNEINESLKMPESAKFYEDLVNNIIIPKLNEIGKDDPDLSRIIKEAFRNVFGNRFEFSAGFIGNLLSSVAISRSAI